MSEWPFDQAPDVAAITTRQIIESGLPILAVIHYADDYSWGFLCGTSSETGDGRVIRMDEVLRLDYTLAMISDLPSGWYAYRDSVGGAWTKQPNPDDTVA